MLYQVALTRKKIVVDLIFLSISEYFSHGESSDVIGSVMQFSELRCSVSVVFNLDYANTS